MRSCLRHACCTVEVMCVVWLRSHCKVAMCAVEVAWQGQGVCNQGCVVRSCGMHMTMLCALTWSTCDMVNVVHVKVAQGVNEKC